MTISRIIGAHLENINNSLNQAQADLWKKDLSAGLIGCTKEIYEELYLQEKVLADLSSRPDTEEIINEKRKKLDFKWEIALQEYPDYYQGINAFHTAIANSLLKRGQLSHEGQESNKEIFTNLSSTQPEGIIAGDMKTVYDDILLSEAFRMENDLLTDEKIRQAHNDTLSILGYQDGKIPIGANAMRLVADYIRGQSITEVINHT